MKVFDEGRSLVAAVREAALMHGVAWSELVPNGFVVNLSAEAAEEAAFDEMARAKRALRDHICETYGVSARELASLADV